MRTCQVGFDRVRVEAKKTKAREAEATLKVIVLDQKTVKVAIRPVQVRDGKQLVSLGNAADPKKLLNEMNAIWNPQANVYFELGRTDPATIDGLPQAESIERHDDSEADAGRLYDTLAAELGQEALYHTNPQGAARPSSQ
jgi:hypothetical protein